MNTKFIKTRGRHLSLAKKLVCAGVMLLSSFFSAEAAFVKIGSGTGSNTATTYPTPFGGLRSGMKAQYLYPATELIAAGMKPGWIDMMGFLVTDVNSALGHTSLKFYVDGTTATSIPAAGFPVFPTTGGLALRYFSKAAAYAPALGWNDFTYSAPYYWNGTDNIVVSVCFWNAREVTNGNASVEWSNVTTTPALSRTVTMLSTDLGGGISICETAKGFTTADATRPNIRFNIVSDTCKAKPAAGSATSDVLEYCIKNDSLEVGLTGNTLSFGLSFQWQSSPSLTGPWSNYGPASTTKVNRKVIQTSSTYYRCIVTCVAASLRDTSKPVFVPMAAPYLCDCSSSATDGTQEKILSVNLESISNLTPCGSGSLYNNYAAGAKAVPPANLEPGTSYNVKTRLGSCGPAVNARAVKIFIDFDQNADYDVTEMVYANTFSASQPNPQNTTGDFIVPVTAKRGTTTMRIVYGQGSALSDVKPCDNYTYGETQDYAINILPFGKPTVTGRLIVCEHDSVVMNATSSADTPVVFTWTGPGGFTGIGPKITFVDADPSLTGTYFVTVTSGGRTSTPLAVEVIVYPKPPVPNVLNANICQYEADGTLKTDGKNVLWYNVPVGGFGDTTTPKVPTHTPNTSTFYLTQTVNGCVSDRGKVVVNVLLKPAPPVVKSPVTYCQLQVPDLAAKGVNLKWYLDSAGGVASTISPIPPTGFPDEIDYYVTQTINGCESDRVRIRVIVYEQPNGLILHDNKYVCQYDTASFYYFGNAPVSYDYKWYSADAVFEGGGGQGRVVYRFNTPGDKVINLFVNNGKCATSKISDTITVRAAPTGKIDTIGHACVGVPISISMDSTTPYSENYQWDWDGGQLIGENVDGGPYTLVYNTPGTKVLALNIYNRTCRSLTINQSIYVHPRPYAKIITVAKVTNYGQDTSAFLGKICSRDTLVFTAFKDSSYKYKWTPDYYFDRDTIHIVGDRMRAPGFVAVNVTSEFGCTSSDSTYINAEPCCDMRFPNAFTPNNDFKNDRFKPIRDGRQDITTFRIVNRWGQVVFESASTDTEGWDGMFAGKAQDMGVYQYYIKYRCLDGKDYEMKGDVTLIR